LITDDAGQIQNHYRYDAFGNDISSSEKISNRIRYTGQQYDGLTQQLYLRARHYNPRLGRFMQEDPYQGDGLNLYTYCNNNPVTYYDPSGYAKKAGCPPGAKIGGDGGRGESQADFYVTPDGQIIPGAAYNLPEFDDVTTQAVLITPDGETVCFSSGDRDPKYNNYANNGHTEQKAAMYMGQNDILEGVLYHNNTNGTCGWCNTMTATFLDEGSSLTVVPPTNAVANNSKAIVYPKTFVGNDKTPKIDPKYKQ